MSLSRGAPYPLVRARATDEMEHRRHLAEEFREAVLTALASDEASTRVSSLEETRDAIDLGVPLIVSPRLPDDEAGRRRAAAHVLVRVGRRDDRFTYAPLVVKNSEVVETSTTRRLLVTDLDHVAPAHAQPREGVCVRPTLSLTRAGIGLAHATRTLQALGVGDDRARVALVDRQRHVWWLELNTTQHVRFNLATYDALYQERLALLDAHDAWREGGADFPTSPYWHRECEDCVFRGHCRDQLEGRDDVSLTHYTNFEQQRLLHEFDVHTRHDLARLDPQRARLARRTSTDSSSREAVLGLAIERLDHLIYRARVHVTGSLLRVVEASAVGCASADVEVDVDMESYADHTYLWGASVRAAAHVEGIPTGYRSFVEWDEVSHASEARIFADFWGWFSELRAHCAARGLGFAAYCFWAQAEDGAMNRAVDPPLAAGPTRADLDAFRALRPAQWIDLHDCAKAQIQTDGPLGLKVLARAAGFDWRDENPSGEASMRWFEAARAGGDADEWRRRILEYNEDDCRATQALRDWLNGPARALAHRDDPVATGNP